MRDEQQILDLYRRRSIDCLTLHARQREVKLMYNNRNTVPLDDMDRNEIVATPNLLQQGIDQFGSRASSVIPQVTCVPEKPGVRKYERAARSQAQAIMAYWQMDKLPRKLEVVARRVVGYAMGPVHMQWKHYQDRPTWRVRHPLEMLPAPDFEPGQVRPEDAIFTYFQSYRGLIACDDSYQFKLSALYSGGQKPHPDDRIRLIEYADHDRTVLIATGYNGDGGGMAGTNYYGTVKAVVLDRFPNPGGCPVLNPVRTTLDEISGQMDSMIQLAKYTAKLAALENIAIEKAMFPETYLVSNQDRQASFVAGPFDGRSGKVNIVKDGTVTQLQLNPGYMTNPTLDRLERAQRQNAGIPAEFSGESPTNVRTGRRGDAVLSAQIDFTIAECQNTLADMLIESNKIAMELVKYHKGSEQVKLFVGVGNTKRPVTIIPDEAFAQTEHMVAYPVSGADANTTALVIAQKVGVGTMSKRTAGELDPMIADAEAEHDQIIAEGLEAAMMAMVQQDVATGKLPGIAVAQLRQLVVTDKMELTEAYIKVSEEAMKAQQEQAQAAGPPMTPQDAAAGATVAATTGAVPEPTDQMRNLADVLATTRRQSMPIAPYRGGSEGNV